jgi:hypothetical protein
MRKTLLLFDYGEAPHQKCKVMCSVQCGVSRLTVGKVREKLEVKPPTFPSEEGRVVHT